MSWRLRLLFIFLGLILLAVNLVVLNSSWRASVSDYFKLSGRELLATAEGDLFNDGRLAKVIKYRTQDGLFVDVYEVKSDSSTLLIDRLQFSDRHDGYFNYQGHVTKLAIADVDGDGASELIVPTFDQQLIPHLNVHLYNPLLKKFEPFSPGSLPPGESP